MFAPLHLESSVMLERGVSLEEEVPGKELAGPEVSARPLLRVGETGEGLEGYTLEEEGGQGCCQETRGGDESWGLPGFPTAPRGQNQRLGTSLE